MGELYQRNRDLQLENDEIPILRDSVEEMKYLESKVVSELGYRKCVLGRLEDFFPRII